jgi:hypothetical protein
MTTKFFTGGALTAVAAALALAAVPAAAQDRHHDRNTSAQSNHNDRDRGDRGSHARGSRDTRTSTPAATQSRGQWSGRHDDNRNQAAPRPTSRQATARTTDGGWAGWGGNRATTTTQGRTYVDQNRNTTYRDRDRNTTYRSDSRSDRRDWRDHNDRDYRDRRNYSQWDRNWRNNSRYDWQRYRTYNRNVYHLRPYYAPYRGYSYRRLNVGFYLSPLFFGNDYLIGDPGYYRLPAVYGPYRWVRYYDDALLVNIYDGQVVDVIYDFFW